EPCTLVVEELADRNTLEEIGARARRIQTAKNIQASGFSRTTVPHHCDKIPRLDLKIDSAQCLHSGPTDAIDFSYSTQCDQGLFDRFISRYDHSGATNCFNNKWHSWLDVAFQYLGHDAICGAKCDRNRGWLSILQDPHLLLL